MQYNNQDQPILGIPVTPEILEQLTTGNAPLCCPTIITIECNQEWAQRQLEELSRIGITRDSLSTKDGVIKAQGILQQNPELLNEPIWEIKNTNKDMNENLKRDYMAYNAAKEEPSNRSQSCKVVSKTAVGYDVAKGHKRAKAARKSRKINRK